MNKYGMKIAAGAAVILAVGSAPAFADAEAHGVAAGSPGFLSGNALQAPIYVPVNVCNNSVTVIGLLNPAFGNVCVNS